MFRTSLKEPYRTGAILDSLDLNAGGLGNASGDMNSAELESINIYSDANRPSFLLLDENEKLRVNSADDFLRRLKIPTDNLKVKVVTIVGNTGEGKSYTLNHTFFDGEEVFRTSPEQSSCTLGVWAAYAPKFKTIILDTEGLLGVTKKENQRTRLLLKVLAVSDIIIYRTRAERLQRDMYTFLGGASKAYHNHFRSVIQQVWEKYEFEEPPTSLGPSLVVFHETLYTNTLQSSVSDTESPEDILRARFAELKLDCNEFCSIRYVGVKTVDGKTSFNELKTVLNLELESTTVRSKRKPSVIYLTLKGLNEKFSSEIKSTPPHLYLNEYFTCQMKCQSCNEGCTLSMGHKDQHELHYNSSMCTFQHQFQNCEYLCKQCHKNGKRVVVKPYCVQPEKSWSSLFSYVWAGYVIECRNCGEIYRSRQHWYGNKSPEETAVITEYVHVWPGECTFFGTQNSAQRVLDGISMISNAVSSVTSPSTKVITDFVSDKTAPSYWRPNHEILHCNKCHELFPPSAKKHHCRKCGEGFCDRCSSRRQPVPSRGWLTDVRVCDDCYASDMPSLSSGCDDSDVRVRKYGEVVLNVISQAWEVPKELVKNHARPSYWTPDSECLNCEVCGNPFGPVIPLHHCRECGMGVCDDCSATMKPVPLKGWDEPVRVCDNCCRK